jgi:hypothetical protein
MPGAATGTEMVCVLDCYVILCYLC